MDWNLKTSNRVFKSGYNCTICSKSSVREPEGKKSFARAHLIKSPKWIPAEQSGKKVRSFKVQPIGLRL